MWYINYDPPQEWVMTSFYCGGRSNRKCLKQCRHALLSNYVSCHRGIFSFHVMVLVSYMFVTMVTILCLLLLNYWEVECMSLEQSTSTWATCGRYTNNGTVLLDHVIIVYACIIFNLVVFLSELLVWLGVFLVHLFSQAVHAKHLQSHVFIFYVFFVEPLYNGLHLLWIALVFLIVNCDV